jgi:hypothetical protein
VKTLKPLQFHPLATTTYSLIVSDTCGMPPANADYVVEVAEFPPFSVTIDQGDFTYDCNGFQLSATATGGDGTYSDWSWTNQDGMNLWGWENSLWYSIWNGEGDVIVSVEDGCGEIASDTVSATTSIVLMQVTQETNYTVTCGSQITLSPEVEFGLEPYYFSWTDMNWFTLGNGSTYTFTAMANTQIQLTISDGCGGYYYNIININIENIPVDLVMPPAFTGTCTEVFLIDPEVSGGFITDDYEYAWSVNGSSVGY